VDRRGDPGADDPTDRDDGSIAQAVRIASRWLEDLRAWLLCRQCVRDRVT
jgi:hypothetical protein